MAAAMAAVRAAVADGSPVGSNSQGEESPPHYSQGGGGGGIRREFGVSCSTQKSDSSVMFLSGTVE